MAAITFDLPPGVTSLEAVRAPALPGGRRKQPPCLLRDLMQRGAEVVALQELPRTLEQVYWAAMAQVTS